jgi:hypothetical protein
MKLMQRLSAAIVLVASAAALLAAEPAKEDYKPDPSYRPTRNLSSFFAKLKAGRPVTVMGIGGSVTEGHSWAAMSAEWLRKEYPDKSIRYVDGAWGGRGPDMTVFRFRRDHLPHQPDLVFIEYTVNCYGTREETFKALDGMVQQLLRQPQKPEIVFVYVGNEKGERGLDKVQPLARYYGFLEVDPRTYLQAKLDKGELTWKDFANDQIHPNRRGHAIYAEPVIELLKQQAALADKPTPAPPVPPACFSDQYTTALLLPIAAAQADQNWKVIAPREYGRALDELLVSDHVGATLTVKANTTVFGAYVVMTTESGKLGWSIDGGEEHEKNMTHQYVRTNDWWIQNVMFTNSLPPGEHTLTLTVRPKSEKSTGNFVHIAGFCVANPRPVK